MTVYVVLLEEDHAPSSLRGVFATLAGAQAGSTHPWKDEGSGIWSEQCEDSDWSQLMIYERELEG